MFRLMRKTASLPTSLPHGEVPARPSTALPQPPPPTIPALRHAGRSFERFTSATIPVVLKPLHIFALLGLVVNLISDLTYTWIDPRIDFETREV